MKWFICLLVAISFSVSSCAQKEDTEKNEVARELFSRSADLILDITRQIKLAPDSTSVDSLSEIYEKRITDINFDFPPQTDLKLNEIENDSLFHLINLMRKEITFRLQDLSVAQADTIPTDDLDIP